MLGKPALQVLPGEPFHDRRMNDPVGHLAARREAGLDNETLVRISVRDGRGPRGRAGKDPQLAEVEVPLEELLDVDDTLRCDVKTGLFVRLAPRAVEDRLLTAKPTAGREPEVAPIPAVVNKQEAAIPNHDRAGTDRVLHGR